MMREVSATEVPARLPELLRTVERGETIAITRRGKAVAHLVPAENQERAQSVPSEDQERARRKAAVAHFMRLRSQWKPTGMSREEILAARHEGHRF